MPCLREATPKGEKMPKIIDVIIHGKFKQISIILDEMPKFLYEKRGSCLVASDDGFYNCYCYERPSPHWKAFAGAKFDIPMKDGAVEKAFGQWWDGKHQENAPEPIISVGLGTLEKLYRCYVFSGGHISRAKLEAWLSENEPSTDYYKYEKNRPIFVDAGHIHTRMASE